MTGVEVITGSDVRVDEAVPDSVEAQAVETAMALTLSHTRELTLTSVDVNRVDRVGAAVQQLADDRTVRPLLEVGDVPRGGANRLSSNIPDIYA